MLDPSSSSSQEHLLRHPPWPQRQQPGRTDLLLSSRRNHHPSSHRSRSCPGARGWSCARGGAPAAGGGREGSSRDRIHFRFRPSKANGTREHRSMREERRHRTARGAEGEMVRRARQHHRLQLQPRVAMRHAGRQERLGVRVRVSGAGSEEAEGDAGRAGEVGGGASSSAVLACRHRPDPPDVAERGGRQEVLSVPLQERGGPQAAARPFLPPSSPPYSAQVDKAQSPRSCVLEARSSSMRYLFSGRGRSSAADSIPNHLRSAAAASSLKE
mmetsp:Transcript_15951/g.53385  ORF Transcript_15951/g.53385 Transcript_15951/m.53385 type:complete len:271 (+) Transcript_15951:223-1035(+)